MEIVRWFASISDSFLVLFIQFFQIYSLIWRLFAFICVHICDRCWPANKWHDIGRSMCNGHIPLRPDSIHLFVLFWFFFFSQYRFESAIALIWPTICKSAHSQADDSIPTATATATATATKEHNWNPHSRSANRILMETWASLRKWLGKSFPDRHKSNWTASLVTILSPLQTLR